MSRSMHFRIGPRCTGTWVQGINAEGVCLFHVGLSLSWFGVTLIELYSLLRQRISCFLVIRYYVFLPFSGLA